jgi:hypothetical protein
MTLLDLPWDWERGKHDINSTLKLRSFLLQIANMVPCLPIAATSVYCTVGMIDSCMYRFNILSASCCVISFNILVKVSPPPCSPCI